MSRFRFRPELFGVLLLTACLTPTDGSGRFGEARVRPQFADGQSPAQRSVHVDSIHTLIRRGDENVVNTVMPYEADAHQAWIIELNSVADDVVVTMELMVGRSVAYRGTRNMTVMEGTAGRAPLENVPMSYVGTNIAARVEVQPDAIALSAVGATRQLQAVVYDPDGAVLDKPVSWTSGNAAVATVNEQGLVTAAGGGNTTITATVDGASDTAEVVVDTAIARSSTIAADSTSIAANGIANTIVTVRILNRDGQPIGSSAGTVMLTTTLGTLGAVTDHADGTYTATLTAGTTPGTAAIAGTLNSNAIADTAFVELRPLAPQPPHPSTTTILADSAAINADATSTTRVTVEVRDVNGDLVGHGGDVVTLATTLGTLSANITDHADGRHTAVLTAGVVAGTARITGTLNGQAIGDTAFVQLRPLTSNPLTTTITADSAAIDADGASNTFIRVSVRDAHGNLVPSADTVRLATTLGTLSAVTNHADGTHSATLTAGTTTGIAAITGTLNNAVIADTAFVQLRPLTPRATTTTITADSAAINADSTSTTLVTVAVRDVNGNLVGHGGGTVALVTTLGRLSDVTDHADGRYTAILTAGIVAGTARITGTLDSQSIGDTAFVQLRPQAANPLTTTITADSTAIDANGVSSTLIHVFVRDAHGNAVASADTVRLVTTLGTLSAVINHADGTYSATLTAGITTGVASITGTLNNAAIADTAFVQLRPLAPRASTTTIRADSAAIDADSTSTTLITVEVRDTNGNLVSHGGGTVALVTTLGRLSDVTDHADGRYTAILTAGVVAGTATITGTLNGATIGDTARVGFRPLVGTATTTTLVADSTSIAVNGRSTTIVTVTVRDQHGNPVGRSSGAVLLTTTRGILSTITDHGDGTYTATLMADTAATAAPSISDDKPPVLTPDTAIITGTLNGAVIGDTARVEFRIEPVDTLQTTIDADSASLVVGSFTTTIITVTVRDAEGNRVYRSAGEVVLHTTLGRLNLVTDHHNGLYTAVLKVENVAGTAVVSGTLNGNAILDTAAVVFR